MWESDYSQNQQPQSFEQSGFSVGRGRGFGMSAIDDALPQLGGKSSFNSAPAEDSGWQEDSGWNEDATTTNNNSSWQNNNSSSTNNYNSGGGYGSKPKGSGCFKCGEEGHMSRECPTGGGKKSGCYKCGEDGHMSRECPTGGGGGERKKGCFKCGEEGHMSRECPSGGGGGGGGGNRGSGCYKCGEEGHMSRECTSSSGGGERKKGCFKCGDEGHMSRDCPDASGDKKSNACFKCGEEGHMSRECTNPDSGNKKSGCFKCGEDGHMAKDCTNPDTRVGPDGKPRAPLYIPPDPSEDATDMFMSCPTGINFSKYDSIPVDVSGDNVPPCITDFKSAKLSQLLTQNIERSGYSVPTPVQKHAIPIILAKRDLMACAETGSGKTAAFLVPLIHNMITDSDLPNNAGNETQEPIAVILAPTRELAIQIMTEAKKFSYDSVVKAEVIYGGTSTGHQSAKIRRGIHILVATPGRLMDFVEKGKVSFAKTKYLVLDEADRMLDMGFMPCVEKIVEDPSIPPKGERQTLMFSATFAEEIQRLAGKFLENYLFLTVGTIGGANCDVTQTFFKLGQFDKREKLMNILKESGTDRVLVFVEQKRTADFLASFTSQNDIPTTSIHGDRLQKEREEALRDFRNGKMPVLVATAVAARGLDIKDVRHVINYDLPQSIDEYVHRIGRTGRVGNLGKATSFYDPDSDIPIARSLKKILMDAQQEVPDWLSEDANNAVGTAPQYSRGNFGGRDVRNQGGRGRPDSSDAWNQESSSNNYSQPVAADEAWD